jgi:hypothetical protein
VTGQLVTALAVTLPVVGLGSVLAYGLVVWAAGAMAAAVEDVEPDEEPAARCGAGAR